MISRSPFHLALAVALLATLAAAPGASAAPKQTATEAIRSANERLRELLGRKADSPAEKARVRKQLAGELRELMDIGFLAKRALVDHWDKMTPTQRAEVQTTLEAIIEKNYLAQLQGNLDYRIEYLGEQAKGGDALVRTVVHAQKNGRPTRISIDYQLLPEGDHWRVFDVITEDVSTLQNYRAQFNRIIAKDGVDGLIARMKARLNRDGPAPAGATTEKAEP